MPDLASFLLSGTSQEGAGRGVGLWLRMVGINRLKGCLRRPHAQVQQKLVGPVMFGLTIQFYELRILAIGVGASVRTAVPALLLSV